VVLLVAAAFVGTIGGATAESSAIGILITSDRDSGHFADPKDTKVLLDGAHMFTNGLILGGSFEYRDQAFSPEMYAKPRRHNRLSRPAHVCLVDFGAAPARASVGRKTRARRFPITWLGSAPISISRKP
jgi:hypothetical protein